MHADKHSSITFYTHFRKIFTWSYAKIYIHATFYREKEKWLLFKSEMPLRHGHNLRFSTQSTRFTQGILIVLIH